ncbi:phospholipase A and acyltransferase 3-like [Littorina saxatilis]|uniref:phospholipase A and acyltransferase 3-like n=1 Tax=Littorina saxatilis TaxID=31220 RepID=UPI0038B47128
MRIDRIERDCRQVQAEVTAGRDTRTPSMNFYKISNQPSIREHNQRVLDELEPGDRVAFDRGLHYHYAIYTGKGKVVHKEGYERASGWSHGNSILSGLLSDQAEVKEESFWKVAKGCRAFRDNAKDRKYSPRRQKDIVTAAVARKGETEGYSVLTNNCETFANECRYDKSDSDQAVVLGTGLVVAGTAAVVGIGALIGYAVSRSRSGKEKTTQ